jgi:hypothetical protein
MTDREPTPGALQAARSLHSIEVELPDGWKVRRIITELGLRRIAVVFDAFAAEAVAAERERCAAICRKVADDHYSAWAEVCETRIRSGREP